MPGHNVAEQKKSKGAKTLSSFATAAAGKGREGMISGLSSAGSNQAKALSGILGAHVNVATKGGVKRVKRKS